MAKKSPQLYSVSKTFIWFAVVSLILGGSLAAIVYLDHHRQWKDYQKKFNSLKAKVLEADLTAAQEKVDSEKIAALKKELAEVQRALGDPNGAYQQLLAAMDRVETARQKAKTDWQTLKQFEDSYRYYFEEARLHGRPEQETYQKKLQELEPKLASAKAKTESLEKEVESGEAKKAELLSQENEIQKNLAKLLEEQERLERQRDKIKPTLAKEILNAPMLDFLAPSLKIQQIVLDKVQDDYHFARVPKVDRCVTCHLGIDQKGFESAPQPFKTHPKLELYLGAASPHAVESFGCTACHGGNGHSVSFVDSAHTPRDEAQKKAWIQQHQWKPLEKWEAKMLPLNHIEAACAKCHTQTLEVPKAEDLNRGRRLALDNGCFNCHKVKAFENAWRVGPDLRNIGAKTHEAWIKKWLEDPTHFRASSGMPKVFNLSNTSKPEDRAINHAAIESAAFYLLKNSAETELLKSTLPGDGSHGEELFKTVGCLGCHSAPGIPGGTAGPELSGLGSKVNPDWLFSWLKDPKRYSQETRMPNLRLSDQEASDIAAYLLSMKNESFDARPVPKADPAVIDRQILTLLQSTLRESEAREALSKMGPEEKRWFLGKKTLAHQGCYSCHSIGGFEETKPIGTELSDEGRKDIHQLDFGFIDLEKTRQAWFTQKLKEPRIFDQGKEKPYYEKLRMPQFNFTEAEIHSLTTFLLSLTQEEVPLEIQKTLDLNERAVEKGRFLIARSNCTACHTLDGQPGLLREMTEDKGSAPPVLDGEGAKVQEKWLYQFLKNPETIRPWLKARMPSFEFNEESLSALTRYFSALEHQEISYAPSETPISTPEMLASGKHLFTSFQCAKCHEVNPESVAMGTSFLAPDLTLTKSRLKARWVQEWLKDPQVLQEGTMMPTYFPDGQSPMPDVLDGDAQKQALAIRDYLYVYEVESKPKEK